MKMKGWKTWTAGLALVGLGAYLLATGHIEEGIAKIGEGAAIIGLGHKIEKASDANLIEEVIKESKK